MQKEKRPAKGKNNARQREKGNASAAIDRVVRDALRDEPALVVEKPSAFSPKV